MKKKEPILRVDYIQEKGIYFELNPVKQNHKNGTGDFRYIGDVIESMNLSVKSPRFAEPLYPYRPATGAVYKWARHEVLPALSIVIALAEELDTNAAFLLGLTEIDCPNNTYTCTFSSLKIRNEQRLSREAVCSKTGLSYQHLSRLENHDFNCDVVKLTTLLSIAETYDVSLDYLLGLTNKEKWENPDEIQALFWDIHAGTPVKLDFPSGKTVNGIVSDDKKHIYLSDGSVMPTTDIKLSDVLVTEFVLKKEKK